MKRVAFLTATCMLPGRPETRADHWEHDLEFNPMRDTCAARDIELVEVVWDDPELDPTGFDAFVIGTTWDYTRRPAAFLDRLATISAARPLFNPLPIVRWNLDKSYLRDLAGRGAPVPPTVWAERADEPAIRAAFDVLDADDIVIKPIVGAGAWRQARLRRGEAIPPSEDLPPERALIQSFLPSASSEGEYSFVFFDRVFSHCALKVPKAGDYRVQSIFGARERPHTPTADELTAAQGVLSAVDGPLLYARVDMLRDASGALTLMELELIEPYLYPEQGPEMGAAFAAALGRMVGHE
ncbi:MAG: hypothetical protein KDA32_02535 [Phycisphaerales bacterium]|nr:hypothetical protein [Phycisphaerales bacterium]